MARPKKEESIRRTSNVMVRFSSIEYELVAGYAKDAGYPISTFVRKQALSEKVTVNYNIVADIGEIQKLTAQAAGIGNNLNQIARAINDWHNPYPQLAAEVRAAASNLAALKFEVLEKVGEAVGNVQTYQL